MTRFAQFEETAGTSVVINVAYVIRAWPATHYEFITENGIAGRHAYFPIAGHTAVQVAGVEDVFIVFGTLEEVLVKLEGK